MRAWLASTVLGALGCAEPVDEPVVDLGERSLVYADRWEPTLDDPFADHQPDTIDCAPAGRSVEPLGLEIDTGLCNYALLGQPLASDLVAGESLAISAFHDDLAAAAPAQGHVAVAIGGHVYWDAWVDIPSAAAPFGLTVPIDEDIDAGTEVVLHLHNHGVNAWTLLDVRAQPTDTN